MTKKLIRIAGALLASWVAVSSANATIFTVTVDGPDAIYLAGRTDIIVPDPSLPWNTGDYLARHGGPTPEEAKETIPPYVPVTGGDIIKVADPAVGGINFFNGFGPPYFGPSGNGASGSNLQSLGGLSGYIGPQGPLAGVFLDDSVPDSGPPAALDFSPTGLGIDFLTLAPLLKQIFYIGDGITSGGEFQSFTAPAGATRLFLAIPDGFSFRGRPGAYDDNDGFYKVNIGVNETPPTRIPPTGVPDAGSTATLLGFAAVAVLAIRRRISK